MENEIRISPIESNNNSCRISKPTGNGPHSTNYVSVNVPMSANGSVPARTYYPAIGNSFDISDAPYHGIVFAPGAGGYETSYSSILSQLASWGYIVTIVGTGGPCNQDAVDIQSYVLDYYEEQNSNASSIFYNRIITTGYGASGHSNGGWAAIAGGVADTRFKAISPLMAAAGPTMFQGQANTRNLHIPLQLVAGASDSTFIPSSDAYYSYANPIKSYLKLVGSGHGGPMHLEYTVAFFKYWLGGEKEYVTYIYGEEIQKDINSGSILYTSEIGLTAEPNAESTKVDEDEDIVLTGDGVIYEPSGPNRTIVNYEWDFDDDGEYDWNSSVKSPAVQSISDNGNFQMTFRVTDSWGMMATNSIIITVKNVKPIAVAGEKVTGFEDELIMLNANLSIDTSSDIKKLWYKWNFGDGNSTDWDLTPKESHIYTEEGEYSATVYVKDDDDALDTDEVLISISNLPPVAVLNTNKEIVNVGEEILFDALDSYDSQSDNNTLKYTWYFGDGWDGEGVTVYHSYKDEGYYSVKLIVEDNDGVQTEDTITIFVLNQEPSCEAQVENDDLIFEDDIVYFTGMGFDTTLDINNLQYSWDFDLYNIPTTPWSDSPDFEFEYRSAGTFYVVLTVRDDDGEMGYASVTVRIDNIPPVADFTASSFDVDEDETIIFNGDSSSDTPSDMKILNYSWDFGDESAKGYGKEQEHAYSKNGKYTVTLKVTDDDGIWTKKGQEIIVNNVKPVPKIITSKNKTHVGSVISFSAHKSWDTQSDIGSLDYYWDFGDKTLEKFGKVVTHSFSEAGRFKVKLMVIDDDKAEVIEEKVIIVSELEPEEGDEVTTTSNEQNGDLLLVFGGLNIILIIILIIILFIYLAKTKRKEDEL